MKDIKGPMDIDIGDAEATPPLADTAMIGGGDENVCPIDTDARKKLKLKLKKMAEAPEADKKNTSVLGDDLLYAKVYAPFDELVSRTANFFASEKFKKIIDDDISLTNHIRETYETTEKIRKPQAQSADVSKYWFMGTISKVFKAYVDSVDVKSKSMFSNANIASGMLSALTEKHHDPEAGTLYAGGLEDSAVKSAAHVLEVIKELNPLEVIDNALLHHAFARLLYLYVVYQWFSSLKRLEGGLSSIYPAATLMSVKSKRKIISTIQLALDTAGFLRPPAKWPTGVADVRLVTSKVYEVLGDFPFLGAAPENDVAVALERSAKIKAIEFLQNNYDKIILERKDKKGRTIYDKTFFDDTNKIEEIRNQDKLLIYIKLVNQILAIKLPELLDINRYNFRESTLAPRSNTLSAMKTLRELLEAVKVRPLTESKIDEYATLFIMPLIWAKIQYDWRIQMQDEDIAQSPLFVSLDKAIHKESKTIRARFNFFFTQQTPPREDKSIASEWSKTTTYSDRTDKAINTATTWRETYPPKVEVKMQDIDLVGLFNSMLKELR